MFLQIAQKVGCSRSNEDDMLTCLKMTDPVGLTMAGKINVLNLLGKGKEHRPSNPAPLLKTMQYVFNLGQKLLKTSKSCREQVDLWFHQPEGSL